MSSFQLFWERNQTQTQDDNGWFNGWSRQMVKSRSVNPVDDSGHWGLCSNSSNSCPAVFHMQTQGGRQLSLSGLFGQEHTANRTVKLENCRWIGKLWPISWDILNICKPDRARYIKSNTATLNHCFHAKRLCYSLLRNAAFTIWYRQQLNNMKPYPPTR